MAASIASTESDRDETESPRRQRSVRQSRKVRAERKAKDWQRRPVRRYQ